VIKLKSWVISEVFQRKKKKKRKKKSLKNHSIHSLQNLYQLRTYIHHRAINPMHDYE
jgi:hypothetical protein